MKKIKELKPRSFLQKVQAQTNWAIHFALHPIPEHSLSNIMITYRTRILLAKHREIIGKLKAAIKEDSDHTKILYERQKRHWNDTRAALEEKTS